MGEGLMSDVYWSIIHPIVQPPNCPQTKHRYDTWTIVINKLIYIADHCLFLIIWTCCFPFILFLISWIVTSVPVHFTSFMQTALLTLVFHIHADALLRWCRLHSSSLNRLLCCHRLSLTPIAHPSTLDEDKLLSSGSSGLIVACS